jgi:hypothetical protein
LKNDLTDANFLLSCSSTIVKLWSIRQAPVSYFTKTRIEDGKLIVPVIKKTERVT